MYIGAGGASTCDMAALMEEEERVVAAAAADADSKEPPPAQSQTATGMAPATAPAPAPAEQQGEESQLSLLERSLRGLTARAVKGIPGMKSQRHAKVIAVGLLEQAVEQSRGGGGEGDGGCGAIEERDGASQQDGASQASQQDVEVAVAKCADLGGRTWTDATARFVFGFVPFFGGMGVQAEALWLQIRTIAIIAALYGHDVESEDVQQAIIVCLMDGAATQVKDGSARLQMERVAFQQVIKKLALSLSGAGSLEGLFNGVTGTLRGQWDGGRPPPALIERCRVHFRPSRVVR
jgi:pyruvate/2-oxoglutarate dehydrogenase complex dihydrolipoamide acyltransferase (E2) component